MEDILRKLSLSSVLSGVGIKGQWHAGDASIDVINPTNNCLISKVSVANIEHVHQAVSSAHKNFLVWRQVPAPKRGEVVRAIGQELRLQKSSLGDLVAIETGKSKAEGDAEVQEMIDMADFAVGQSRMLYGLTMPSERVEHRMYEQWHPLGVVGVITAFNFPVAVWAWNAFLALIAGNSVVWKPSVKAPLSAIAVIKICWKVLQDYDYPKDILSILVAKDIPLINELIDHASVPLISFTGSTEVGRSVNARVAKRLGRCLLELGGNNGAIIMPDANLDVVVPAVVFGAVGTAGQRCTSLRRLFVHESIYADVLKRLVKAYQQIKVGDPLDKSVHMGPLIDQDAVAMYQDIIAKVKALNGSIHFGGNVLKDNFVKPALITASIEWQLLAQENFVPILWLVKVPDLVTAIKWHNQSKHGLSSAIFSQDIQNIEAFLSVKGSDCGIVCVNQSTSGAEIGGAFGGEKATGGGREAGSDAWKNYMRRQTVTINYSNQVLLAQGIEW